MTRTPVRCAALLAALLAGSSPPRGAACQVVAFVDVTVVPMDRDWVLKRQTVIVREGRIAELGPAARVPVPEGALRVDGRGKYLMPGLAEMHGHLPTSSSSTPIRSRTSPTSPAAPASWSAGAGSPSATSGRASSASRRRTSRSSAYLCPFRPRYAILPNTPGARHIGRVRGGLEIP